MWATFFPTIYSTGGDLDLTMQYQNNQNTTAGRGSKSSDMFATERLRVYLNGFVFHPRFIQFLAKGSGGLFQERSDSSYAGSLSENGLGTEYEFRAKVLPEHPYNLELYTLRATPLLQGQSSADTRPTLTEKGAIFTYEDNPVFFNLSYVEGATETRISSSEQNTARISGSHGIGPFVNSAGYARTNSSTSSGTRTSSDLSFFGNKFSLHSLLLDSSITKERSTQTSLFFAGLHTDTFTWMEQFNADLPWNFSTSASYDARNDVRTIEQTATEPRSEERSNAKNANFTLAHKLYDSVRTYYLLNQTSSETSSGDTKGVLNALNGLYTKRIPDGRITIGAQGSRSIVNQENAPLIVGEIHTAPLFGTFTLTRESVDPSTISIRVLSDVNALIDLVRNANYIVELFGTTTIITILSLPPEVTAGQPANHIYSFQVTYALAAATVELQTTTIGYSVNLSLFNNLIAPYHSRVHSTQVVLAGSVPGGAQDTVNTIIGVGVQKAPYALVSEYQSTENDISPSHSLRNSAEYVRKLSDTTGLSIKAQQRKTVYGEGTLGTGGYTEYVSAFNITISNTIPRKNLYTSLGAAYSQRHATFDTNLYALMGNLSWKVGTLSVNLGTSLNHSTSTGAFGNQTLLSEFYYMTVSRKLF